MLKLVAIEKNKGFKRPEIIEKNDFFEVKMYRSVIELMIQHKEKTSHGRLWLITVDYG